MSILLNLVALNYLLGSLDLKLLPSLHLFELLRDNRLCVGSVWLLDLHDFLVDGFELVVAQVLHLSLSEQVGFNDARVSDHIQKRLQLVAFLALLLLR